MQALPRYLIKTIVKTDDVTQKKLKVVPPFWAGENLLPIRTRKMVLSQQDR
jgi:hypothetical protein